MTPKEKALQLFNSFRDKTFARTEYCQNRNAKDTALICVDEIITELGVVYRSISATSILFMIGYWREVEQEINKL